MFYLIIIFFFFNDTATTEIYTLSLHDALPISLQGRRKACGRCGRIARAWPRRLRSTSRQGARCRPARPCEFLRTRLRASCNETLCRVLVFRVDGKECATGRSRCAAPSPPQPCEGAGFRPKCS